LELGETFSRTASGMRFQTRLGLAVVPGVERRLRDADLGERLAHWQRRRLDETDDLELLGSYALKLVTA
jgi:hypothetical protein